MIDGGVRSRSASATPAPLVPSPRNATVETNSSQQSERWADVLFAFHAEYPDELTIDVRISSSNVIQCYSNNVSKLETRSHTNCGN